MTRLLPLRRPGLLVAVSGISGVSAGAGAGTASVSGSVSGRSGSGLASSSAFREGSAGVVADAFASSPIGSSGEGGVCVSGFRWRGCGVRRGTFCFFHHAAELVFSLLPCLATDCCRGRCGGGLPIYGACVQHCCFVNVVVVVVVVRIFVRETGHEF